MNTLYLLFEARDDGIAYGAFSDDHAAVYKGFCPIVNWGAKPVTQEFHQQILAKLRGHGKVFSAVGIVAPIADLTLTKPQIVKRDTLKQLGGTAIERKILEPTALVLQASQSAWPHLPHYLLNDSFLSAQIGRTVVLPPFSYDMNKQLKVHPYLVHSYGHKANLLAVQTDAPVISLYIGNQVSAALFVGGEIKDAIVSYSPISAIASYYGIGAIDAGYSAELAEKFRSSTKAFDLLRYESGLMPMTERKFTLELLLELSGMVPRKGAVDLDDYPIETIEWIELAVRNFIRSLKHAVGALAAHESTPEILVVNTSEIAESSPLWPLVLRGGLKRLKRQPSNHSLLEAASHDMP